MSHSEFPSLIQNTPAHSIALPTGFAYNDVRKTDTQKERTMDAKNKTSRIDIRLMPEDKNTLEAAAAIKRVSVSAYILSAAMDAAKADIEREENIVLGDEARDNLLRLLENPPEPNEALRRLFS